ncbi:MAG TPA: hypothetical protein VIV65_09160 [Gemmatimonadaceae bacterium]|jgi:hypothetical protein
MSSREIVLLSYVPLLTPEPGEHVGLDRLESLLRLLRETPAVKGLVWVQLEDGFVPVFGMERGYEVARHLIDWSEGRPEEWFSLRITRTATRYTVTLAPNISKSIARYKQARRLQFGEIVPSTTRFKVLFQAIQFVSVDLGVIGSVAISDQMQVGFMDWGRIEPQRDPLSGDPVYVGPFTVRLSDSL